MMNKSRLVNLIVALFALASLMSCAAYLEEVKYLNEVGMDQYQKEEKAIKAANKTNVVYSDEYVSIEENGIYSMKEYLRDDKVPLSNGGKGSIVTMVDLNSSLFNNNIKIVPALGVTGYYYIQPLNSDLVWTVKDSAIDDLTPIVLETKGGRNNQLFSFSDGGSSNLYLIRNKDNGKLLYSYNGQLVINTPKDESIRYMYKWELILQD
ncbi:MAG: RICIN domain-containing protein [Pleomorphochaeta sp.]